MKKAIIYTILFFAWCGPVYGFSGGSGTIADPYLVASTTDLVEIGSLTANLALHYKQTAPIDLSAYSSGVGWEPIGGGGTANKFTGSYDGQFYTISNLTINRPTTDNVGLFGHVGDDTLPTIIKNIVLDVVNVVGARGTGSLIGRVTGNAGTLIERCSAINGTVVGDAATGGLVGSHNSWRATFGGTDNPVISQCFANINVTMSAAGTNKIKFGGLVGCTQKGTILDSYARGSVNTEAATSAAPAARVGGLAGCAEYRGEIIRSYSTGAVIVDADTTLYGGLVGNIANVGGGNNGVVVDSYWDTQTSGQATSAAGFPRSTNDMKIQSTFATFDFVNIWGIDPAKNNGYPYLLWENLLPTDPPTPPTVEIRSRRALDLDGVIDHVRVPHSATLDVGTANTVTVEAWVKKSSDQTDADGTGNIAVVQKHGSYNLYLEDGNQPAFSIVDDTGTTRTATSATSATSVFRLTTGKWYHLAGTFNNSTVTIYINGYALGTAAPGAVGIQDAGSDLGIGVNVTGLTDVGGNFYPSEGFLHGTIDEVRVWNTARPLEDAGADNDIRDFMCKKLVGTESGLAGYWRFDEDYGLTCVDETANVNDGTILSATRVCSQAPIGDESSHDYTGTVSTEFIVDTEYSAKDERLIVSAEAEGWSESLKSGLQVYRVNNDTEPQSGPIGSRLLTDIGYWGVFVTGGAGPTYKVQYTYDKSGDGISGVGSGTDLRLNWRHGNCENWKNLNATLDPVLLDTLTIGGQTGTEFILGTDGAPRNAINFDGTDDVVTVSDSASMDLDLAATGSAPTGTLEAWIYIDAHIDNGGIIHKGDNTDLSDEAYSLSLGGAGTNTVVLTVRSGNPPGNVASVTSNTALAEDTWYHVAGVWDDNTGIDDMRIYFNGVLDTTLPATTLTARTTGGGLNIGQQFTTGAGSYAPFDGYIDEVRVWDTARDQDEIRNTMCRKITSTEPEIANLMGYWRFDEETSSPDCPDETINDNDGAMAGFNGNLSPTSTPIEDARICSAAPIGDYSASNYTAVAGYPTVTLDPSPSRGSFQATATGAVQWPANSGIHVYRLDEAPLYQPDLWIAPDHLVPPYGYISPNGMTPPAGWSSIDYYRYFGVFVTNPTGALTYDVVYDYTNNPMRPDDDSEVRLARRPAYCFGTWTDTLVTPTAPHILTYSDNQNIAPPLPLTGSKQNPEYILGGDNAPLAITLASFTAIASDGCVDINWETATEINTAGFHVWRSGNPFTGFVRVTSGMIASTSEMETMGATYSFRDCGVDFANGSKYYYMLEEIEMDTTGSGNMHGPIGPVSENVSAAQGGGDSNDKACFIGSLGWWEN